MSSHEQADCLPQSGRVSLKKLILVKSLGKVFVTIVLARSVSNGSVTAYEQATPDMGADLPYPDPQLIHTCTL